MKILRQELPIMYHLVWKMFWLENSNFMYNRESIDHGLLAMYIHILYVILYTCKWMCSIIIAFSISTANQFCNQQDSCKALLISYSDFGNSNYFHLIINSGMYVLILPSVILMG